MTGTDRQDLVDVVGRMCADAGSDGPDLWRRLDDAGFTGLGVPEQLGGSGGDLGDALAALVALGAAAAPVPLAESTLLGGWLLATARLPVPAGPLAVAFPAPFASTADPDEPRLDRSGAGGARLSGRATAVAWGRIARHVAVLAASATGPAVAVVDPARCTVSGGTSVAGEPRDELRFPDLLVEAEFVGCAPEGTDIELLLRGALSRTAMMVGAIDATVSATVAFTTVRHQFGQPIAAFQAVQHELAALAGEAFAARAALRAALAGLPDDRMAPGWLPIAAAKLRVGRAAGRVAAIAHQLHGAVGFTQEHPLHRWTTRLWSWRDEYGAEAQWAARIGADVARRGPVVYEAALILDGSKGWESDD